MVLHRPVELAGIIGRWDFGVRGPAKFRKAQQPSLQASS